MKKIFLLSTLLILQSTISDAQITQYHIHGSVEVGYKHYDLGNFIGKSEYAELLLVVSKNRKEIIQSGPTKNNNLEYFTLDKFYMNAADTLHIDCWDMDKNSIWLLGLNGDDFIYSFHVPCINILDSTKYVIKSEDKMDELTMYINKYYNAGIKVLSFTVDPDVSKSDLRMTKRGLFCKLESEGEYTSTIVKGKKGKFTWNDGGTAFVYDGMELKFDIKTSLDEIWTKFNVTVQPGIQTIVTGYGAIILEITPY